MVEAENLVLMLLREMRSEMATKNDVAAVSKEVAGVQNDIADLSSDVKSLRADVASDLADVEKRLGDRIAHLNRAVMEYHPSAVGHDVLISEFEERLRRVEQHLKLPPTETH
jgi:septal ring factor EnvC (AmiA/AmiB activator)